MLTEKEKHGISELLARMSSRDLTSLAQTVTSRLIVPETHSEAVSAIILHSEKPSDLLRRRKIKKELLFKYLNAKKVGVDSSADKSIMISHVLQLWGANGTSGCGLISGGPLPHEIEEDSYPEAPAPSRNTSYSSLLSLDINHPLSSHGLNKVINQHIDTGSDTENSLEMDEDESAIEINPSVSHHSSQSDAFEMACSFVRWYYPLINGSANCDTDFGSQHFWLDASAQVSLQSGIAGPKENSSVEENGKLASELLKEVVQKHKVAFNPNISREGVHGVIDAHGLAIVIACGTLHTGQTCCGTFQQKFGLIRDPTMGNNWKIKYTNATLVSRETGHETPTLNSSCLMALTTSSTASSAASSSPPSRESPSNNMAFS